MQDSNAPIHFIGEAVQPIFTKEPIRYKTPKCPDGFIWRGTQYTITEIYTQWVDFSRKGRMKKNMRETHRSRAEKKGSWGAGKFYFKVRVNTGQVFEIYYDRSPQGASKREGTWFLLQEYA